MKHPYIPLAQGIKMFQTGLRLKNSKNSYQIVTKYWKFRPILLKFWGKNKNFTCCGCLKPYICSVLSDAPHVLSEVEDGVMGCPGMEYFMPAHGGWGRAKSEK